MLHKNLLWGSLCFLVIFTGIFFYNKYLHTINEGYCAGLLQKISREGKIIKTYEGEMIINSIKGNPNIESAAEKFYFSVTSKNMVDQLDTIQGQMVIVHYQKKNGAIFWRGDSPYLVDSLKYQPKLGQ
jgi:hypothetical protein